MSELLMNLALNAAERGYAPDGAIRWGIRRLCAQRREECNNGSSPRDFAQSMRLGPVAPVPKKANEQHYEIPPEFFEAALGSRLKYSCCLWPGGVTTLDQAEEAALVTTCERAEIADGHEILELGCGWGSLSLWMAEKFPASRILSVSNSAPQRRFIENRAAERGLHNLEIITCDMNDFSTERRFDRVVSVEMFEHMRNYELLLGRVASWLNYDGKLFVHIFCHRTHAYAFETNGAADWLAEHFFTGGIMPNFDIFEQFQCDMKSAKSWRWNGTHYEKTANAWLKNMDAKRHELLPVFESVYGKRAAAKWFQRWRIFFMSCAELWGYADGSEWLVGHYLLEPVRQRCSIAANQGQQYAGV
ncbi:MAG: cyclopropane-fatty-acyl-phospholipid synthase [Acidobacteria bacterium]|nr:cyclopropane-fatty-acyl-phospholipid synthase [Acidobacteriota bacterium]